MAQTSRTFFVSSTFSDLKAERDALQKHVFPRLRELRMQQTMKICLKEIARCQEVTPRPNFIVLLGDRYGWRPLPEQIPAEEFERLQHRLTEDEYVPWPTVIGAAAMIVGAVTLAVWLRRRGIEAPAA